MESFDEKCQLAACFLVIIPVYSLRELFNSEIIVCFFILASCGVIHDPVKGHFGDFIINF